VIEAKLKWQEGLRFEGTSSFGHKIITDGARTSGGSEMGYRPTELVLFALAGCTGMDVVKILEKMRQKVTGFEIEVKGQQPEEYPKPYNKIDIKYIFTGKGLDKDKIATAIGLSKDKYCMVSQTLAGVANICHEIEIREG